MLSCRAVLEEFRVARVGHHEVCGEIANLNLHAGILRQMNTSQIDLENHNAHIRQVKGIASKHLQNMRCSAASQGVPRIPEPQKTQ